MTAAQTDAELIADSLTRPERFEAIFDHHASAIHRYLRRRVGDQLAEELTAETFARASVPDDNSIAATHLRFRGCTALP